MMRITLLPNQKGKKLENLFGLFFEDLNHAADGGLYAELIRNRDFEFDPIDRREYTHLTAWAAIGNVRVEVCSKDPPFPANPHYAQVWGCKDTGISNLGFGDGIPARANEGYKLVIWARSWDESTLDVRLVDAITSIQLTKKWARYEAVLTPEGTDLAAKLLLTLAVQGSFETAWVSLMPLDTWSGKANMLRKDIAQALADMKPRFLRFPGGCLTHDGDLNPDARNGIYNWKRTIGPVENRPSRRNNWGYHQSMGLGFYEYFLLCEDLGCEPVPVLNGGIDPHHLRFAEGEVLEQYIQDAIDLIDFAKGDVDTEWGHVRAKMGHPEPFHLRYLAIGNEEIHEEFHIRNNLFAKALRDKDPTVELIGSSGPFVHGKPYEMGWDYARRDKLSYVDEHYYLAPEWFLANIDHYSDYPVDGPKVILGEYATWGNRMENALAEAAYMTGLQNAPAVAMACYAPMLCHTQYVNWVPDMLFFDNHRLLKTANYYVQKLFMNHQGDYSIPVVCSENVPGSILSRLPSGRIFFSGDETDIHIRDIRLTTKNGTVEFPNLFVTDRSVCQLGETSGDFRFSFTLERTGGRKGCMLNFCHEGEENHYRWVIGGWQNSDSAIEHYTRGRLSCITQSNLYLQNNHVYEMTLEVKGNEIITTVDGEELNRVAEKPLQLRPLYMAASIEEKTDDVILKVVNVQEEPVIVSIDFACGSCMTETLCALPETQNTIKQPEAIHPIIRKVKPETLQSYTIPGHSVTIMRMTRT